MNKKGMEFAIGTFVAIILGLAMFTAGSMIFYNIYDTATLTQDSLDQNVRDQILRSFSGTNPLYLPQTSITVNREKSVNVYFAVQNNNPTRTTFDVEVTPSDPIFSNRIQYFDEIIIDGNSRDVGMIIVDISDIERGQYVFTVSLEEGLNDYGSPRIFTINI